MSCFRLLTIALLASIGFLHARMPGEPGQITSSDEVPAGLARPDWERIRAAYEDGRHAFQPIEGGWQARNPGQEWVAKFDGRGFITEPKGGRWSWGLELKSYGFGEQRAVAVRAEVKAEGQRLTYTWDAAVEEWFVNDRRGLEHGFTISERPPRAAASPDYESLDFRLAVRGTLRPHITKGAMGVEFCDATDAVVLTYAGLKVWDADGRVLPVCFTDAGEGGVCLSVDERGARYPLTIDPIAQQTKLLANDGAENGRFGESVAVWGDIVVVGATEYKPGGISGTGAAYVFMRNGNEWNQRFKLLASDGVEGDAFGRSVAVWGNTIVVGASRDRTPAGGFAGSAYVFVWTGISWTEQAHLFASDGASEDLFGGSVALAEDTIVVGAPGNPGSSDAGSAYVFVRNGTTWTEQAHLGASDGTVRNSFGSSVAISGGTIVVGAPFPHGEPLAPHGRAYVFVRDGTIWTEQAKLLASDGHFDDWFGRSVAVSDDTIVVGAPMDDNERGVTAGSAYVFTRDGTAWTEQAHLMASDGEFIDEFGNAVAISGDIIVVGESNDGSLVGSAFVFFRTGTEWIERAHLVASDPAASSAFGNDVAISGNTVVVGSYWFDSPAGLDVGAVYVFSITSPEISVLGNNFPIADGDASPLSIDHTYFGLVAVGGTFTRTFTIANGGDGELTLGAVTMGGEHAQEFIVVKEPATTIPPGGSTTFTIRFTPANAGIRTASVSVGNDDDDENPYEFSIQGGGLRSANLAITVSDGNATLTPGDAFTYTIVASNSGFSPADGATVTDTFPAMLTGVTWTGTGAGGGSGPAAGSGNIRENVNLPAGASFTFIVNATIPLNAAGMLVNTATISPPDGTSDLVTINNSSTDSTTIVPRAVVNTALLRTGDVAPGVGRTGLPDDAVIVSFGTPATDNDGDLAFIAKWKTAVGGSGSGLFLNSSCLGIVGGDAPGVAGGKFKGFTDPVVDGGSVACIATLGGVQASSASAVMSNARNSTELQVVARAGDIAPGLTGEQPVGGARFSKFKAVSIAGDAIAFLAQLTGGSAAQKATVATDSGLWIKDGTDTLRLAVREGQIIGNKKIKTLVSFVPGAGSAGQGRGWLTKADGAAAVLALAIFTDKSQAVLSLEAGGAATILSETGVIGTESAPPISGAAFASYGFPAANANGTAVFLATMKAGAGGVTNAGARGVFVRNAGGCTPLAQVGNPAGATGANFSVLKDPVLSADDIIAFPATLKGGTVKGLATQTLWWTPAPGALELLAQCGQRPGPDLPAAMQWKSFTSLAIAAGRGPIFSATLVPGRGGVTTATASGVWAVDYTGAKRLLFRTGDTIGGRKLVSFALLNASVGNPGVTRSFNDAAEVVWLATFIDKSQAIVTTVVP